MMRPFAVSRLTVAIGVALLASASVVHAQGTAAPRGAAPPPVPPGPPPPPPASPPPPPVGAAPATAPAPAPPGVPPEGGPPLVTSPDGPPPPVYYSTPTPPQSGAPGAPPPGYPGGPYVPPAPPPEVARGAYMHDGFYLRMGLGIGRMGATFKSSNSDELGGSVDGSLVELAAAVEFAIGGTPAPGLVIGGGVFSGVTGKSSTSDLTVDGRSVGHLDYKNTNFAVIGPFIDYYFDERSGFHLQGALGVAVMDVASGKRNGDAVTSNRTVGGLGFMVGGGYEWFIAEQWSLGGVARLRYGAMETDRDDDPERWSYAALAIPEILFTATYH